MRYHASTAGPSYVAAVTVLPPPGAPPMAHASGISPRQYSPLTLQEYQAEAARTMQPNAPGAYLAAKLIIEAAEASQPIIKATYHGAGLSLAVLQEELGDCLWYLAALAESYGLSLDAIAAANLAKLRARHGASYNPEHYLSPATSSSPGLDDPPPPAAQLRPAAQIPPRHYVDPDPNGPTATASTRSAHL